MSNLVAPATDETVWSASRLNVAARCGTAYEYQYIRKLPAPYETGALMFGNAVHNGVEQWYGPDDDADNRFKERDLAPLVLAQWREILPPVIWGNVESLRDLDEECDAVAAAVLFKRPDLKAPRTTKEFLDSAAYKEFNEKRLAMIDLCDALDTVKWARDEDPYKGYLKSAAIAKRMQERWQHLPRPLAVERSFQIEIEGFKVRGRIDMVRRDPGVGTGEAFTRMVDIKTGRNAMTPMEAFLQSFIYCEAIKSLDGVPDTDDIAFYMARLDKYQQGRIDYDRHRRLASRVLNGRARQIAMGQFEPSYGFWCKRCDFEDVCSKEISLWSGDGLVVELMDGKT